MNATEIVIREVQGDGGFQVRQLLAERIGESGKASHLHPHGQDELCRILGVQGTPNGSTQNLRSAGLLQERSPCPNPGAQ